jgi:Protein of unknown function (DUF2857)
MIALLDPHQRYLALSVLLARLEQGEPANPAEAGLDPRLIERLRGLKATELVRLAEIKHLRIGIRLEAASLEYALHTLERLSRESRLLERCIAHQAPRALLAELFGPQAVGLAYDHRRRQGEPAPRGRPPLPDPATRDRIHARWHEIRASILNPAERYLALAEAHPGLTLATLHAVITEFRD